MFGIDDAALVGLIGTGVAGGLNLMGQSNQQGYNAQSLQLAMQNYLLQKQQADRQYQLATASRTDARGNKTFYVPGVGWQTQLTPTTQSIINESDAITQANNRGQIVRGESDRSRNFQRRLTEGSAADPLLQAVINNYGGPTREGVTGKNTIANVTGAAENADAIRNGYTSAALRTGGSTVPLAANMNQLDRGGTAGIRSALAKSDAEGDPLFQAQLRNFQGNKLDPYNMLATRAGNSSDVPFQPENISSGIDSSLNSSASMGAYKGGAGSEALYRGLAPVLGAYGQQTTPNYDLFAAGVTANLKNLLKGIGGSKDSDWRTPSTWDMSQWTGGI